MVPVIRSCQSPIWIWLVNYLHLHYITLLTKRNRTPPRYTLAKHTTILQIPTPPSRSKSTHKRRTYIGMRPHAPGQQAGDHPVPAHTERHNPSKVWTQRQAGSPRTAVSSDVVTFGCVRRGGIWSGIIRSILLLARFICLIDSFLGSRALPGLFSLLCVTQRQPENSSDYKHTYRFLSLAKGTAPMV